MKNVRFTKEEYEKMYQYCLYYFELDEFGFDCVKENVITYFDDINSNKEISIIQAYIEHISCNAEDEERELFDKFTTYELNEMFKNISYTYLFNQLKQNADYLLSHFDFEKIDENKYLTNLPELLIDIVFQNDIRHKFNGDREQTICDYAYECNDFDACVGCDINYYVITVE